MVRVGGILKVASQCAVLVMLDYILTVQHEVKVARLEEQIDAVRNQTAVYTTKEAELRQKEKKFASMRQDAVQDQRTWKDMLQHLKEAEKRQPDIVRKKAPPPRSFLKNRVVMEGPLCTQTPKAKKRLPKFVFVAGIEGSGHHGLIPVWEALKEHQPVNIIVYDQLFHSFGIENHASYHYSSILLSKHKESMKAVFQEAAAKKEIVIDAQNSYPMGMLAGSLAHPDLTMMTQLDGVLFDLRVIVLYRNPIDSVLSAVRRFKDSKDMKYKNPQFQARMVSESLTHLNNMLKHLPCEKYMTLYFEDFVKRPEPFIGPLARILGVPKSYLQKAFHKVKKRPHRADTPETAAQRKILKSFFEIQQTAWPLLSYWGPS